MEDRRHDILSEKQWWGELNYAQQSTANGLANVGYELAFIRRHITGSVAVFTLDNSVITVDCEGEANMTPNIAIR